MAEIQTNNGLLPPQILRQIRQIGREFKDGILPLIKAKRYFVSRGEKRREKTGRRPSCRKPAVRFSPFAMVLGYGLADTGQPPIFRNRVTKTMTVPARTDQLVSIFIIAMIKTAPPVYVLQKIQKKSAPGFPGGGIENGETILGAAAREFKEESSGADHTTGVDVASYNPACIGKFVLDRAVNGEQGAVVFVEIPKSEIANLKAGGGDEEGEVVEELFFWTFEEISERTRKRTVLPNAVKIWDLYCDYLVNAP